MTIIARAVGRFKNNPKLHLDHRLVHEACAAAGYGWRDRVLGPVVTLRLMIVQVLHGNISCRALGRVSGLTFSVTAYCKARARLPVDVLGYVASMLTHAAREHTREFGRWRGHRVLLIDGTGVSMPDTPGLQRAFGQPGNVKPGCGFPVMHVLWVFDAATGLVVDFVAGRWNRHDLADASKMHPLVQPGDVLVGDRAFCSYAHLALLLQDGMHAVFRAHQRLIVDFTPGRKGRKQLSKRQRKGAPTSRQLKRLGHDDQLVHCIKPSWRPDWMNAEHYAQLPGAFAVRELRYTVTRRGFRTGSVTLVTTLLDPERYPKEKLADLYQSRWQIETNLGYLKTTMGMDVLRCKSRDGVIKELWTYMIVYNLVRMLMLEAAQQQDVSPNRVSFTDALDTLRYYGPTAPVPTLTINPTRPGRDQPRVIKRRRDRYTVMTKPRRHYLAEMLDDESVTA
jgi:Transposase DDE domain